MSVTGEREAVVLAPARQPYFRFAPEKRLAKFVAVTALLWLLPGRLGPALGEAALAALFVTALVEWAMLPSKKAIVISRAAPDKVGIGDSADGECTVHVRAPYPIMLTLTDQPTPLVHGGIGSRELVFAPHSTQRLAFTLRGETRGRGALGSVGVRARTRLGLIAARARYTADDSVLVVPSLTGVRRYRLLAMQHRLETVGVRTLRRRGEGSSFANLREYAVGDDPRRIDWKATARRARLITREYTVERSQTVFTLIDAGRSMTQLAGERSRFEYALSSSLILTDIAATTGDRVGTLVFDDDVRAYVAAQQGRRALQAVRDAYVPLTAVSRESDYASAFRFLAAHQRKRALVVFITDVIDPRASQALIAHVSRSAARHLVVVVALRSDAIFAAALPRVVGGTEALYECAAAEELIAAREEALLRMRRAGVSVLDVSPYAMTASVINRYLEIKARGLL